MSASDRKSAQASRRRAVSQPAPTTDPTLYPVLALVGAVLFGLYVMRLTTNLITHPADHVIGFLFWGVVLVAACYFAVASEFRPDVTILERRIAAILVLLAFLASMGILFEWLCACEPLHIHNAPDRMFVP